MNTKHIFIFEFVSGGGFNQIEIPSSLFCEGYGMLRSIIADFKAMDFEITTLLDERISFLSRYLEADSIQRIKKTDNYASIFKESLKECDYAFIVAPEFANILYNLTNLVKEEHKKLLSIGLKGIELGSSKIKTYDYFRNNKIKTPKTYQVPLQNGIDIDFVIQKFREFNSPLVFKPLDGVGAESIYYFDDENQIYSFFKESKAKIDLNREYIIQEYVEGEDLSVSIIGPSLNAKQPHITPLILSINYQDISINNLKDDSEYFGGHTPVEHYKQIKKELSKTLEKLDLSMFNGYFGIDFIKSKDSHTFIEINPRLTTSYIGIRNILNVNPVECILKYYTNSLDLEKIEIENHSIFKRLELEYLGDKNINDLKDRTIPKLLDEVPELVTPPISFEKSIQTKKIHFSCFIATKENNINESRKRYENIGDILYKKYNFQVIR
jgi:predicted ATP-grasp superfamily ATP-dependent carboligase